MLDSLCRSLLWSWMCMGLLHIFHIRSHILQTWPDPQVWGYLGADESRFSINASLRRPACCY